MPIFENDYGAGAVSEAIKGFLQGAQQRDALDLQKQNLDENKKFREMEFQSRVKADAEAKDRQSAMDEATAKREQAKFILDASKEGKIAPQVEEGKSIYDYPVSQWQTDPNAPKLQALKIAQERAQTGYGGQQSLDLRKDVVDRREHERVLTRVASNPVVKARLTQYQNLDNALAAVSQAENLTPQQVHEFQQSIRSNLGIKGTGGVGEREETYFKSLGLNAANMKQFLTGDPATLAKDSKMMIHLKDLAAVEQSNIRKQLEKALSAASGGHGSMYARRPDLKQDLMESLAAQSEQIAPAQGVMPNQGLIPANQQAAPAKPKTIKQNGITYTLNPQTGEYE